ncbi:PRTRC system protein E [Bifidobacterium ramosum]|uniref:PRTRC system protein E n=1 Tax=Bifidobacterium ramosum TaxID=1798158 RepID=A0A6L4X2Z7_9BIFI|nr:PRTRC system protein E [Bifidobacterium ramosum]KAB8289300.1 PRTRC system protein E [Bifidobacterium ramosum]NEG71005.1 PRTRC system protein E [Bifidobacterium ramosum]
MPPLQQLFASTEFWTALILALVGGGGLGGLIGAWSTRNKTEADIDNIAAEAASKVRETLGATVDDLREHVDYQARQIKHLEEVQEKYFKATAYTRRLFHWLQDFCEIAEPDWIASHPKPSLPDDLRPDIAPETIGTHSKEES